jgi:hypothetical protein
MKTTSKVLEVSMKETIISYDILTSNSASANARDRDCRF